MARKRTREERVSEIVRRVLREIAAVEQSYHGAVFPRPSRRDVDTAFQVDDSQPPAVLPCHGLGVDGVY